MITGFISNLFLGKVLFPGGETLATVKSLADASMAIIKENVKFVDVMKVEIIQKDDEAQPTIAENTSVNTGTKAEGNKNDSKAEIVTVENTVESDSKTEDNITDNETKTEDVTVESDTKKEDKTDEKTGVPDVKNDETPKPIYALATLEWGAFRDVQAKQNKYWYWGSLRNYAAYVFNGYKNNLTWNCNAEINYLEPCEGCSNCYIPQKNTNARWWSRFWSKPKATEKDYSKVKNERCSLRHSTEVQTSDFMLKTANILGVSEPKLQMNIGPGETNYLDFVREGFKTIKGEDRDFADKISARQVELLPKNIDEKEIWFSIDKEDYEAMPVRITLLPKVLKVFCKLETS